MDPSKLQSDVDVDNDANSLESTSSSVEVASAPDAFAAPSPTTKDGMSDATGGSAKPPPAHKPSIFMRIWQRFNVYLLLFVLVVLVAIATTIVLFIKDRNLSKDSKDIISTQSLSDESLKQLSSTSVNIGNSKQILNVESNAIFAGAILIRSNLEVAGNIKVGGELQLPGISVSGASKFGELQADNISIGGSATIQGVLNARKGLSVVGNSTFLGSISATQISTSSLQLDGDLVLTHHITAGGPIPKLTKGTALGSGGTASISGSDTSGSITINTGSSPSAGCFVTIIFDTKFNGVPHVVVSPVGSGAAGLNYYVNRSTSDFSVCTTNSAPGGQTLGFDYIALD